MSTYFLYQAYDTVQSVTHRGWFKIEAIHSSLASEGIYQISLCRYRAQYNIKLNLLTFFPTLHPA
jgi:hypothetical protein